MDLVDMSSIDDLISLVDKPCKHFYI